MQRLKNKALLVIVPSTVVGYVVVALGGTFDGCMTMSAPDDYICGIHAPTMNYHVAYPAVRTHRNVSSKHQDNQPIISHNP